MLLKRRCVGGWGWTGVIVRLLSGWSQPGERSVFSSVFVMPALVFLLSYVVGRGALQGDSDSTELE